MGSILKCLSCIYRGEERRGEESPNTVSHCQKCIDITEKTGDIKLKLNSCLLLIKTYEYLQQYDGMNA